MECRHKIELDQRKTITGSIGYTVLRGASAYEMAVANGYSGTEEEFVNDQISFADNANEVRALHDEVLEESIEVAAHYREAVKLSGKMDADRDYISKYVTDIENIQSKIERDANRIDSAKDKVTSTVEEYKTLSEEFTNTANKLVEAAGSIKEDVAITQTNKEEAQRSASESIEAAKLSKHYSELIKQDAEHIGYVHFDIEDGDLILTRSEGVAEGIDFVLNDKGELEVIYS